MPCRRPGGERFLLLERAVSLQSSPVGGSSGSKEVDTLVAKLGEVLQLSAHHRTPPPRPPKYRSRDRVAPYSSPQGLGFLTSLHRHPPVHPRPSLLLLQPPPPPPPPTDKKGSPRVAKQLCGRGWLRSSTRAGGKKQQHPLLRAGDDEEEEDDPHRLLQQLILSGNLIKEAVRRLQLASTTASTAETSTTDTPGSASSIGSCHSSIGEEGDSAAAAAAVAATTFAVSSLQPLP